jgi:hypothetical protein
MLGHKKMKSFLAVIISLSLSLSLSRLSNLGFGFDLQSFRENHCPTFVDVNMKEILPKVVE